MNQGTERNPSGRIAPHSERGRRARAEESRWLLLKRERSPVGALTRGVSTADGDWHCSASSPIGDGALWKRYYRRTHMWKAAIMDFDPKSRPRRWLLIYGTPVLGIVLAMVIRVALEPILAGRPAFVLFELAVMGSASVGGRRSGVIATIVGAGVGTYLFLEPYGAWDVEELRQLLQIMLFILVGGGISFMAGQLHNARLVAEARAAEAQDARSQADQAAVEARQARLLAEQRAEETAAALERVRVLSGLLPICASCKKIRDTEGSWEQLEVYIGSHSDAEFTHSLCPVCAAEFEAQI